METKDIIKDERNRTYFVYYHKYSIMIIVYSCANKGAIKYVNVKK